MGGRVPRHPAATAPDSVQHASKLGHGSSCRMRCCPALCELDDCTGKGVVECEALLLQLPGLTKLGLGYFLQGAARVVAQLTQMQHLDLCIRAAEYETADAMLQPLTALTQLTQINVDGVDFLSNGLRAGLRSTSGYCQPWGSPCYVLSSHGAGITNTVSAAW